MTEACAEAALLNTLSPSKVSELQSLHKTGATSDLHAQLKGLGLTKMGERVRAIGALQSPGPPNITELELAWAPWLPRLRQFVAGR